MAGEHEWVWNAWQRVDRLRNQLAKTAEKVEREVIRQRLADARHDLRQGVEALKQAAASGDRAARETLEDLGVEPPTG